MPHAHRLFAAVALAGLGLALLSALPALAGPLNPPAGPVVPTYKTLTEVEPRTAVNDVNTPGDADSLFVIRQPGSYYLAANVNGVAGKNGIKILAGNVSLDLNGFAVLGVPQPGGVAGIVSADAPRSDVSVFNGSVSGWSGDGVNLSVGNSPNCTVRNLRVSRNLGAGIRMGFGATVHECAAHANGLDGVSTGEGSIITSCMLYANGGRGLSVLNNATVSNCSLFRNMSDGIQAGATCVITNCSAFFNLGHGISADLSIISGCTVMFSRGDGIRVSSQSVVTGNLCHNNGDFGDAAGIRVLGSDNRIEGNNCTFNDRGIEVNGAGNFIARNTCSGNTVNWDVAAMNRCLVINSTANPAAILGDAGGTSPGSTDPNANFTY